MRCLILSLIVSSLTQLCLAHPSPNSLLLLEIQEKGVAVELQLPLSELELAFGKNLTQHPYESVKKYETALRAYILAHFKPTALSGEAWGVNAGSIKI